MTAEPPPPGLHAKADGFTLLPRNRRSSHHNGQLRDSDFWLVHLAVVLHLIEGKAPHFNSYQPPAAPFLLIQNTPTANTEMKQSTRNTHSDRANGTNHHKGGAGLIFTTSHLFFGDVELAADGLGQALPALRAGQHGGEAVQSLGERTGKSLAMVRDADRISRGKPFATSKTDEEC